MSSNHLGCWVSCSALSSSETSRASGPTRPQPSLPAASLFLTQSGSVRHLLDARITRQDHSCSHSWCTPECASATNIPFSFLFFHHLSYSLDYFLHMSSSWFLLCILIASIVCTASVTMRRPHCSLYVLLCSSSPGYLIVPSP